MHRYQTKTIKFAFKNSITPPKINLPIIYFLCGQIQIDFNPFQFLSAFLNSTLNLSEFLRYFYIHMIANL